MILPMRHQNYDSLFDNLKKRYDGEEAPGKK